MYKAWCLHFEGGDSFAGFARPIGPPVRQQILTNPDAIIGRPA